MKCIPEPEQSLRGHSGANFFGCRSLGSRKSEKLHVPRIACFLGCLLAVLSPTTAAWAQGPGRQSIEVGVLGQTTYNKVTAPYHIVEGPSSVSLLGTNHAQVFAGPLLDYTYGFTNFLSAEGRASYLLGKQPVVNMSGGNALLLSGGIRASFGPRRIKFYVRLAPGIVSFNQAGTALTGKGYDTTVLTHFTLDEGGGLEVHFARSNAFRVDASRILYVEGGRGGSLAGLHYTLPGDVEDHLTFTAGLAHYFGDSVPAPSSPPPEFFHNAIALSFAWQRQPHLAFSGPYLSSDAGVALSASHALAKWIGLDTSAIVLPGGDAPNYQDGGAETELLAGVRVGVMRARYGIFAKYRAGAASFSSTINQNVIVPPHVRSWDYATDSGAIVEYYPKAAHFLMRLDAGEQYTRYHSVKVTEPPPEYSATQGATFTNSPLILVGVGWRF
jgi:hypothetical protein